MRFMPMSRERAWNIMLLMLKRFYWHKSLNIYFLQSGKINKKLFYSMQLFSVQYVCEVQASHQAKKQ